MDSINIEVEKTLKKAIDYSDFVKEFEQHSLNKTSSGNEQSEMLSEYTHLNYSRIKRLNKTLKLSDEIANTLKNINTDLTFLVLTESWCGDAAQTIPVLFKVADHAKNINFKIAYRDDNDGLMQHFLTNGNKAIPILILLDSNQNVIANWGPRPTRATQMVNDYKKEHGGLTDVFKKDLQIWYNKDKGINTMQDLSKILTSF